jgi:tRNA(Ile)-lysidine synthase
LRYEFLFSEAERINAQAVAVGHTADDQAETILMHLLRGTGLAGLKGMEFRAFPTSWSAAIPLVRPLLTTWRAAILAYCQQYNLITVQDTTNQSLDYFRNQVRLDILPHLAAYQPNIRQNLVRMANTLAADYALLQCLVEVAWQTCLIEDDPGYVAIDRKKVLQQPLAIQRYLLRQAMLLKRAGVQDIEFSMIERARHYLGEAISTKTYDVGAGLRLRIEQNIAWIIGMDVHIPTGDWPAVMTGGEVELSIPGSIVLQNGWVLQALLYDAGALPPPGLALRQDHYQATFDVDRLDLPLLVRQRQPGDRMQPAGMDSQTVKVSDLMINLKLPARSRSHWPLVCSGDHIIWVPGCRQSYLAQPGPSTQRVVRLRLYRPLNITND